MVDSASSGTTLNRVELAQFEGKPVYCQGTVARITRHQKKGLLACLSPVTVGEFELDHIWVNMSGVYVGQEVAFYGVVYSYRKGWSILAV